MDRVEWPELDLRLSRLAFGCAPVMGRVGRRQAMSAMALAFERGVTHFDIARSYGFGEAERVLGDFIADKPGRVTIATKFGIRAARLSRTARLLKPAVRQAQGWVPGLAGAVRKGSSAMLTRGDYGLEDARTSLETSLRELRADVIDLLFVHDCTASDALEPRLIDWLSDLKRRGLVKAWGLATHAAEIEPVSAGLASVPDVVQLPAADTARARAAAGRRVLHSPISQVSRLRAVDGRLASHLRAWGQANGLDEPGLERRLPGLLLQATAAAAPEAVILCSMFQPANIQANVTALDEADAAMTAAFSEALDRVNGGTVRTAQPPGATP